MDKNDNIGYDLYSDDNLYTERSRKIVLNRIRTPDGTLLSSYSVHDYNTYTDKNGLEYMVDGGLDYLRRTVHNDHPYEELSVYLDEPFEKVRESFHWGNRGKDGRQPLQFKPISEMSNEHLKAIIDRNIGGEWCRELFTLELEYRNNNNIEILD